ncbi:hypothetical protein BOX15_Mlig005653g2 [Macrostomum lignano]|uniref:RUN domain-containing protein n=1 Tax=Macrostomum lignano TaxID=282301 RepID=A0A267F9V5_9PLAT|nr:hypothetical protein BOX15_Mlig005653g2 [Macrostomum lignano]
MQPFEPIVAYRPTIAQSLQEERQVYDSRKSVTNSNAAVGTVAWQSDFCLTSPTQPEQCERTRTQQHQQLQRQRGTTWAAVARQRRDSSSANQASQQATHSSPCQTRQAAPPCSRRTTWRGLKSDRRPSNLRILQHPQSLLVRHNDNNNSSDQKLESNQLLRSAVSCSNLPDLAFLRQELPAGVSTNLPDFSSSSNPSSRCSRRRRPPSGGIGAVSASSADAPAAAAAAAPRSSRGRSRRRQKVRCSSCDDHAASRCLSVPPAKLSLIGQDFHVIPQSVGLYGDDEDSPPLEFCGSPVSSKPAQTAAPSRLPVPESPTRQLNRLSAQAASAVEQLISICSLPSNGQSSSVIVGLLCRSLYSLVSNGLAMSSAWSTAKFVNQFGGNVSKARTVQQRSLLLKKSRLMASPLCLLVEESCASCVPIGLKLSAIVRQINASKSESNGEQGRFDAFVVACLNAGFLSAWLKHLCSNTDLLKRNYRPLALLRQGTPASLNSLARLCSLLDRLQLMQKQQHRQHANRRRNYWPMPASQTEQRQSSGAVARKFRSTSASRLPRPKSAASLGSN